jgi:maltose O-acetyltransferase
MPTEREKMLAGELYDPLDSELVAARKRARDCCNELNDTRESPHEHQRLLMDLFGSGGETVRCKRLFTVTAENIYLGTSVFFNVNCVVLDVCEVRLGD